MISDDALLIFRLADGAATLISPANDDAEPGLTELSDTAHVAYSPDGRLLAHAAFNGLRLWNTAGYTLHATLSEPGAPLINALAFSASGALLAAANAEGRVLVWDTARPNDPPTVLSPRLPVLSGVAFSHDDRTLATSGIGGHMLWDTRTWTPRATLAAQEPAESPAFSPDGDRLYAASLDGLVSYDLDPARLRTRLCATVGRELTAQEWLTYAPDHDPPQSAHASYFDLKK